MRVCHITFNTAMLKLKDAEQSIFPVSQTHKISRLTTFGIRYGWLWVFVYVPIFALLCFFCCWTDTNKGILYSLVKRVLIKFASSWSYAICFVKLPRIGFEDIIEWFLCNKMVCFRNISMNCINLGEKRKSFCSKFILQQQRKTCLELLNLVFLSI